ncbi:MAG: hypothetical protein IKE31_05040, partial [Eubacterium sp.]|nr:hypothetical protein [Eubacterium sp.]
MIRHGISIMGRLKSGSFFFIKYHQPVGFFVKKRYTEYTNDKQQSRGRRWTTGIGKIPVTTGHIPARMLMI